EAPHLVVVGRLELDERDLPGPGVVDVAGERGRARGGPDRARHEPGPALVAGHPPIRPPPAHPAGGPVQPEARPPSPDAPRRSRGRSIWPVPPSGRVSSSP